MLDAFGRARISPHADINGPILFSATEELSSGVFDSVDEYVMPRFLGCGKDETSYTRRCQGSPPRLLPTSHKSTTLEIENIA